MFSTIFDVVMGILLLYLILSMVVSAANEFLSSLLQLRARHLEYFVKTLFTDSGIKSTELFDKTFITTIQEKNRRPSYIQAQDFTQALLDLVVSKSAIDAALAAPPPQPVTLEVLQNSLNTLPENSPLKKVLASAIDKAQGDVTQVAAHLQAWYDNSMDRVGGWFKRQVQLIMLGLGLLIALVFNVDTIAYADRLLQSPALRSVISEVAAKQQPNATDPALIANLKTQLEQLNIPIGWGDALPLETKDFGWWLKKILGLLITGFAVSQGAPFWFDVLNKVTNLRSTGKPPEKAPPPVSEIPREMARRLEK
jgi:hypothetical protein